MATQVFNLNSYIDLVKSLINGATQVNLPKFKSKSKTKYVNPVREQDPATNSLLEQLSDLEDEEYDNR